MEFWTSCEMREELCSEFQITGQTLVVLERFVVVR
jgi:hypothetical protein